MADPISLNENSTVAQARSRGGGGAGCAQPPNLPKGPLIATYGHNMGFLQEGYGGEVQKVHFF